MLKKLDPRKVGRQSGHEPGIYRIRIVVSGEMYDNDGQSVAAAYGKTSAEAHVVADKIIEALTK